MLNALIWLLGCQLAGEAVARVLSLPVPGPVLGMLLLFLILCARRSIPDDLRATVPGLLRHLSMLFIPAGVGVMLWRSLLAPFAWSLLLVVVMATLVTWLAAAATLHWLGRPVRGRSS
ncbi:MAG: CidA/LrgA family protein [Paludibacterium sp.]|uniref:CidA/LrgA family protein n=1 Tax=Paludibacterium sp. TaxID=1917523 RepID=UPI0025CF50F7|nr:CidA/LrgA family protein [Paludibacterium sp.]MBV8047351.1 CidA/LrgA family protein [Paludibacterium sp.]MBV8646639.1 CidA/LrgA family protein [Paludibacterium sp.]